MSESKILGSKTVTLETFGQTVSFTDELPFQVGYKNITSKVESNGNVRATQSVYSVIESTIPTENVPRHGFSTAVLPVVLMALGKLGVLTSSDADNRTPTIGPVDSAALPDTTLKLVQSQRYATFEFQSLQSQSKFIFQLVEAFLKSEFVIICSSRDACRQQMSLLGDLRGTTAPYAVDIDAMTEKNNREEFAEEKSKLPPDVLIRPAPRFVVGTPDGLAKHDWGNLTTKQFILVTDARLFGQKPFEDYVRSIPNDEARIFFLDTKRSIWTSTYAGRIVCSVGAIRLLVDDSMNLIPYPTIRYVKLKWRLPKRSLRDISDILLAIDSSSHRVHQIVRCVADYASKNSTMQIVVVSPTRASADLLRAAIDRKPSLQKRCVKTLTTSEFESFFPSSTTIVFWAGARARINTVLESFIRARRGAHVIHWIDFVDSPYIDRGAMPDAVTELLQANRNRQATYRSFGFIPPVASFYDYCLELAAKEIIHAL